MSATKTPLRTRGENRATPYVVRSSSTQTPRRLDHTAGQNILSTQENASHPDTSILSATPKVREILTSHFYNRYSIATPTRHARAASFADSPSSDGEGLNSPHQGVAVGGEEADVQVRAPGSFTPSVHHPLQDTESDAATEDTAESESPQSIEIDAMSLPPSNTRLSTPDIKARALSIYAAAKDELKTQDFITAEATRRLTEAFDRFKDAEAVLVREQDQLAFIESKVGRWRHILRANESGKCRCCSIIESEFTIMLGHSEQRLHASESERTSKITLI
jgi:hypothetical protein